MKSKKISKKKRRRRPQSSSVAPSAQVMEDFQRTQYLAPSKISSRKANSSFAERSTLSKLQTVQEREQKRQETILQSYQNNENRRQELLRRINLGNLKMELQKKEKEGRLPLDFLELREERIREQLLKQQKRDEAFQRNKLMELIKQQNIEARRQKKEYKAMEQILINQENKRLRAVMQEKQWDNARERVQYMEDYKEFMRGVAQGQLASENARINKWIKKRERERREAQLITQSIEKQRLEIVEQFERLKKEREIANMDMANRIKNQEGKFFLIEIWEL